MILCNEIRSDNIKILLHTVQARRQGGALGGLAP
jgi:hypothetical protein